MRFVDDAFTFSGARSTGHILAYFIPGDGADTRPRKRRLNWVWYVGVDEADLPRILVDHDGRQHHASLPFGGSIRSRNRRLISNSRKFGANEAIAGEHQTALAASFRCDWNPQIGCAA